MAWLPLVAAVVVMPLLAVLITQLLIVPQLKKAVNDPSSASDSSSSSSSGNASLPKAKVALKKVLVNVAGSAGTRYLMVSMTLVGDAHNFEKVIDSNRDQLLDLAGSILSSKTITDLEKPDARNTIRAELISSFNSALRKDLVKEIYFTEFAIQ